MWQNLSILSFKAFSLCWLLIATHGILRAQDADWALFKQQFKAVQLVDSIPFEPFDQGKRPFHHPVLKRFIPDSVYFEGIGLFFTYKDFCFFTVSTGISIDYSQYLLIYDAKTQRLLSKKRVSRGHAPEFGEFVHRSVLQKTNNGLKLLTVQNNWSRGSYRDKRERRKLYYRFDEPSASFIKTRKEAVIRLTEHYEY